MKSVIVCLSLLAAALSLVLTRSELSAQKPDEKQAWIEPMQKVHARFTGTKGTLACFGDSISVTMAFWSPLEYQRADKLSAELAKTLTLVKDAMKPECWSKWKGPDYGNNGSMTIRWAHANIDSWLKKLNPEVAVIMFGTNDLTQLKLEEYDQKTRQVVDRCLKNGTVVILTTIPPRSGQTGTSGEVCRCCPQDSR